MTTVLAVYSMQGCVGRCDSRCHFAKSKTCDCICGGENHGKGEAQAIENNLQDKHLARFAEEHGFDPKDLKVINRAVVRSSRSARLIARASILQPDLFDERRAE